MSSEVQSFHPMILWSQDVNKVILKATLSDVENPKMKTGDTWVEFRAVGRGANGMREYEFRLELFNPIDDETSDFKVTDAEVVIVLIKKEPTVWSRLTGSNARLPWLRTDFQALSESVLKDMLASEDIDDFALDSDDSGDATSPPKTSINIVRPSEEEIKQRNMERAEENAREQYEQLIKSTTFNPWENVAAYGPAITVFSYACMLLSTVLKNPLVLYLLVFNIFQWAGYAYVFGALTQSWWKEGQEMKSRAFDLVIDRLAVVQTAAFLEIAHALLGWVKAGVLETIIQVCARNLVLFLVLLPHEELQEDSAVFTLFVAWSIIELVRYPYYALSLVDEKVGFLTYLRYTLWVPLYPIGFMCEGKLIVLALPLLEKSRRFCLEMPNAANISFDFPMFLHAYLLLMLPGFLIQIHRMYLQRRQKLMPSLSCRALRRQTALANQMGREMKSR